MFGQSPMRCVVGWWQECFEVALRAIWERVELWTKIMTTEVLNILQIIEESSVKSLSASQVT